MGDVPRAGQPDAPLPTYHGAPLNLSLGDSVSSPADVSEEGWTRYLPIGSTGVETDRERQPPSGSKLGCSPMTQMYPTSNIAFPTPPRLSGYHFSPSPSPSAVVRQPLGAIASSCSPTLRTIALSHALPHRQEPPSATPPIVPLQIPERPEYVAAFAEQVMREQERTLSPDPALPAPMQLRHQDPVSRPPERVSPPALGTDGVDPTEGAKRRSHPPLPAIHRYEPLQAPTVSHTVEKPASPLSGPRLGGSGGGLGMDAQSGLHTGDQSIGHVLDEFSSVDLNQDGVVDREEFSIWSTQHEQQQRHHQQQEQQTRMTHISAQTQPPPYSDDSHRFGTPTPSDGSHQFRTPTPIDDLSGAMGMESAIRVLRAWSGPRSRPALQYTAGVTDRGGGPLKRLNEERKFLIDQERNNATMAQMSQSQIQKQWEQQVALQLAQHEGMRPSSDTPCSVNVGPENTDHAALARIGANVLSNEVVSPTDHQPEHNALDKSTPRSASIVDAITSKVTSDLKAEIQTGLKEMKSEILSSLSASPPRSSQAPGSGGRNVSLGRDRVMEVDPNPNPYGANLIHHSATSFETPSWSLTTSSSATLEGQIRVAFICFLCISCPASRSTGSSWGSGPRALRACC